jgi:hypothetical protein
MAPTRSFPWSDSSSSGSSAIAFTTVLKLKPLYKLENNSPQRKREVTLLSSPEDKEEELYLGMESVSLLIRS